MAKKPEITTLINDSSAILNAIRANGTVDYRNYVPLAEPNSNSIKKVGAIILSLPAIQNEFLTALINRVARTYITSRLYENPWAFFKKGFIDFGDSVEEVWVDLAKSHQYDPETSSETLFKREIPDVKAAFHIVNYKKFYKNTIEEANLEQAFLNVDGVYNLVGQIIQALYTSANYDEYQVMKYMIARRILNGYVYTEQIPEVASENMKGITSVIKGVSNDMTFMKTKYNLMGVHNQTDKSRQYILIDTRFDASNDVEVLASAFNMDKADFMGRRVLVDGFGDLDTERLAELFEGDNTYEELSQDEMDMLNTIPAVTVDDEFFQIWDKKIDLRATENHEGLYRNYVLHIWKILSISPFANAVAFIPATPSVTGVNVTPSAVTLGVGGSAVLTANVETENFASKSVVWTSDSEYVKVDAGGTVTVLDGASGEVEITATSTVNNGVTGSATITIA